MTCDARTRFSGLLTAFFLVLSTEALAQPGQWILGVRTETYNINRRFGDPPGGGDVPQPPPIYVLRITDVIDGSAAERAGLEKGDMIVAVNGQRVTRPKQLEWLVRGSNGTLQLKLRDYDSPTSYKLKTIQMGGPAVPSGVGTK